MEVLTRKTSGGKATLLRLEQEGEVLSFADVVHRWQNDLEFCDQWNQALAEIPYLAYRWELPGLTEASLHSPFECVLVESLELRKAASREAFAEHFADASEHVVVFSNLRGDATLIVPTPTDASNAHAHLADFVRSAPAGQRCRLWQSVGNAFEKRLRGKPVWLSTAGAGVPWLHVRLDDRPKYYSYGAYRCVLAS